MDVRNNRIPTCPWEQSKSHPQISFFRSEKAYYLLAIQPLERGAWNIKRFPSRQTGALTYSNLLMIVNDTTRYAATLCLEIGGMADRLC